MRFSVALSFLVAASLAIAPALACGPFFPEAILAVQSHPDLPLKQFAAGNIGIIRPTWARSYFVVAYRYLANKPLSAEEQKQALALWHLRLLDFGSSPTSTIDQWQAARQAAGFAKNTDINDSRSISTDPDKTYDQYINCPSSAFTTAADTLKGLVTKYGAGSPLVKDWVTAQDAVFCHCGGPTFDYNTQKYGAEPAFPQPAPADADAQFKADRAYQQAAALFYAQQFDKAKAEFSQIAHDSASPWSSLAPYLVARSLVRQATLATPINASLLAEAVQQLQTILTGSAAASVKSDAQKLLSFVELRLHPAERLHALSADLQNPAKSADFSQNLYDYTQVIDNLLGVTASYTEPTESVKYSALPAVLKQDEMTDWLLTMQASDQAAHAHALAEYNKTGSLPWLTAVMATGTPSSDYGESLLQKAQAVPSTSRAAFPTIAYALIQQFKQHGKAQQAQDKIRDLQMVRDLPPSARNLVLDEQLPYAKTFEEFLRLSMRQPAVVSPNIEGFEMPDDADKVEALSDFPHQAAVFAPTYAFAFNTQVPLTDLVKLAQSTLPADLAKRALIAAWTRAILLDDQTAAQTVTPLLLKAESQLAPWLRPYDQAQGADRRFAAIFLMLHNPGMRPFIDAGVGRETPLGRIDDYSDNWWCAEATGVISDNESAKKPVPLPSPAFLSADEKAVAAKQYAQIKALGSAPDVLTQQCLDFANAHPTDARVPEALALCVKATRFGCKDTHTNKLSKEAFQILHTKYPQNPWTKKTPYWY